MSCPKRTPSTKGRPEFELRRRAARRFGIFSATEAYRSGWSRSHLSRRLEAGVIKRLLPRTYRFIDHPRTWEQRAMAVQVWAGAQAALSGRTAARIWGLSNEEKPIEVTAQRKLTAPRADIVVRRTTWRPANIVWRGPFRVTHVCRTLVDLAGESSDEEVETMLNICLHRRLTTHDRLARYLSAAPRGLKGLAALNACLRAREEAVSCPRNMFGTKFMRLLRQARLPVPVAQHKVKRPNGRLAIIDFAYPHAMVAIETDGFETHGTYRAWREDRARRNALEAMGWRVLQITYRQLCDEPEKVVGLIRALLYPAMFGR